MRLLLYTSSDPVQGPLFHVSLPLFPSTLDRETVNNNVVPFKNGLGTANLMYFGMIKVHSLTHSLTQSILASLLCGGEGQLEVVFAVGGVQRVVVKLQREERVDQSAESHPVTPAGREVLDIYVLREKVKSSLSITVFQKWSRLILVALLAI